MIISQPSHLHFPAKEIHGEHGCIKDNPILNNAAGNSVEMAELVYMFPTLSEFNLEVCALGQAITVGGEDVDSVIRALRCKQSEPIIP